MTMKTKNRSLVHTKTIRTCRGVPLELRYYRLSEEADDGTTRFGAAVKAVGEEESPRAEVPDITTSREDIDQLLATLARGTVTPVSLREVVEDLL